MHSRHLRCDDAYDLAWHIPLTSQRLSRNKPSPLSAPLAPQMATMALARLGYPSVGGIGFAFMVALARH